MVCVMTEEVVKVGKEIRYYYRHREEILAKKREERMKDPVYVEKLRIREDKKKRREEEEMERSKRREERKKKMEGILCAPAPAPAAPGVCDNT